VSSRTGLVITNVNAVIAVMLGAPRRWA